MLQVNTSAEPVTTEEEYERGAAKLRRHQVERELIDMVRMMAESYRPLCDRVMVLERRLGIEMGQ